MDEALRRLLARRDLAAKEKDGWLTHWQDLAEYFLPRRADFTGTLVSGAKRTEKLFDGTSLLAARYLASAVDSLLKPKGQKWAVPRLADEDSADEKLGDSERVRQWLQKVQDRMFRYIYDPRARFIQHGNEVDLDLVVFGTGILFAGENAGRLSFRHHHLNQVAICLNDEGAVDLIFLDEKLTARQAAMRYGEDKLGDKVKEALTQRKDGGQDETFNFVRAVMPRRDRDRARRDNKNLPWAAVDIDLASEHKIVESGYHEFPYIVPRWDTAMGETYGRSPAMIALPDVKTLNQIGKTLLKAGHKAVDPPLMAPSDSIKSAVRTWPGGMTYFDASALASSGGRAPIYPLETGKNIPLGREMQNDIRNQVWDAFFRNILNLPTEGPQMTATEVLERKQEFVRVIGPVFGRLEADYTNPLMERVFGILLRMGAFDPIPEELLEKTIKFEFESPVTLAYRMVEVGAYAKTLGDLAELGQVRPDLLDNFDSDKIARGVAEANGMRADWLHGIDDRDEMRQQRAEAQAQQAQAAALAAAVEAAPKATQATKNLAEAERMRAETEAA